MASKFLTHPGEQLLAFHPKGKIRAWGDRNAHDSPQALERYAHPFYRANQRVSGKGGHCCQVVSGI